MSAYMATVKKVSDTPRYRAVITYLGEEIDDCKYARDNIADARNDAMDMAEGYPNCELDW